jgi:hypothetical protein
MVFSPVPGIIQLNAWLIVLHKAVFFVNPMDAIEYKEHIINEYSRSA